MYSVLNHAERRRTSAREMQTACGTHSWVLGATLTIALGFSYTGALIAPEFLVISSVGIALWAVWAFRYPTHAFSALLLVWFTFYSRAVIPVTSSTDSAARGGLGLGDLLWFVYSLAWTARWGLRMKFSLRPADLLTAIVLLYLGISFLLPLLGVWLAGHPLTYAVPSLRPIQWGSFVLWGYWFCSVFGASWFLSGLVRVTVLSSILHALYALLQILAWQGSLPLEWLALDFAYEQQFAMSWFYIQRATGLFVNPNTYGFWGATCLVVLAAMLVGRTPLTTSSVLVLTTTGIWAVATAASRTALIGLIGAFMVIVIVTILNHPSLGASRRNRFLPLIAWGCVALVLTILAFTVAPEHYVERLAKLLQVTTEGATADPNAEGRLDLWDTYLRAYEYQYPLGSWAPPAYILNMAVDNYFIELAVQGTPLYSAIFVSLLLTTFTCGLQLARGSEATRATIGAIAIGLVVLYGIAGMALSLVGRMELLWLMLGALLAAARR